MQGAWNSRTDQHHHSNPTVLHRRRSKRCWRSGAATLLLRSSMMAAHFQMPTSMAAVQPLHNLSCAHILPHHHFCSLQGPASHRSQVAEEEHQESAGLVSCCVRPQGLRAPQERRGLCSAAQQTRFVLREGRRHHRFGALATTCLSLFPAVMLAFDTSARSHSAQGQVP